MLTSKTYTGEENEVRKRMYANQYKNMTNSGRVAQQFIDGIMETNLPINTVPNAQKTSDALFQKTGWQLVDAENPYLSMDERFDNLSHKQFPVTNYIRPMRDISYTPLPDLFHEYFGHMPMMHNACIAAIEYKTAILFKKAKTNRQKKEIFTLSRYTIEYGLIKEKHQIKAYGAGILSSPGDLQRLINDEFMYTEGTIENILLHEPSPHKPHKTLFVFESINDYEKILDAYEKTYMNN